MKVIKQLHLEEHIIYSTEYAFISHPADRYQPYWKNKPSVKETGILKM